MDEEQECIHGLGPISACTICNGRDKREAKIKFSFTSYSQHTCDECWGDIDEGDSITVTGIGIYICINCAEKYSRIIIN